ncbi:MAG: malto-oligosyltrehalose synthase [Povalibacter sp.]
MRDVPLRATYRVQLNREFTFADATRVIPYLARLGISHLYTSPILKARPGSMHGYDVTDHTQLNPDLGTEDDFVRLCEALRQHEMGLIVDIVPNHLGVMGNDNQWWLDVLENGPSAQNAHCFDIDWRPNRPSLRNRLLVPVLGDVYGAILERGEIKLKFDTERGEFNFCYHEHRFPIDPREYPRIFKDRSDPPLMEESAADFASLLNSFARLPARNELNEDARTERYRDKEAHKRRLLRLIERDPEVLAYINNVLAEVNGRPEDPSSFDALDALHDAQAYRLAYWRVASDEINYRRFFDVNTLAALRMNDPSVFEDTHRLIARLVAAGNIQGLRIDHSDGLYDPEEYFSRLRNSVAQSLGPDAPFYVVTEKILAQHERLPESWAIQGTTGYEFGALATAWLVDTAGEAPITRVYRNFVENLQSFEEIAYQGRKLVMRILLAPEVEGLATQLDRLAQADRHTADFTRPALREAIMEVIACFPIYRTYISPRGVREEDRRTIDWAVSIARKRSVAADVSVFDFLRDVLLVSPKRPALAERQAAMLEFAMKFQQVTSPVTAKGVEDTALYRFNRFACLNEVGSDPRRFGVSSQAVHQENAERAKSWPLAMLGTSTHDSKRSEDVRARLAVLSEIPDDWRRHLSRWARLNRSRRSIVNDQEVPDRDDEYLLYQSLLGIWDGQSDVAQQTERLQAYAVKAAREAKRATSWINVNNDYEHGLNAFAASLLESRGRNAFLHDFEKLAQIVGYFGYLNSMAMVLLKLGSPGVPDIYQGNESTVYALVDPDNRRRVDFDRAQQRIAELEQRLQSSSRSELLSALLSDHSQATGKLFVTYMLLKLRREYPDVFIQGRYEPLNVEGEQREHLLAFARTTDSRRIVVVVSRWACKLMNAALASPIGNVWGETTIDLPAGSPESFIELFANEPVTPVQHESGQQRLRVANVLAQFPFAVLVQQ